MDCELATITSQADIDDQSFPTCVDQLDIVNASGILNVTIPALGAHHANVSINVYDSPELLELHSPLNFTLQSLIFNQTTKLTTVSMPHIETKEQSVVYADSDSAITVPLLQVSIRGAHNFESISLNTTSIGYLTVDDSSTPTGFENITYVHSMDGSTCIAPNVESVYHLSFLGDDECISVPTFDRLSTVHDLKVQRNPYRHIIIRPGLQVNETLTAGPSIAKAHSLSSEQERVDLSYVSTVGDSVEITSNSDFAFDLSKLTTVGAELRITNNTNSTFDITLLEEVGNLTLIDNIDTILPLFPNLAKADNILLRGNIDTSPGPNIFPALSLVSGTVTIEAWNDDFNCSKLVSQWRDSRVHNLICNGTDNGNTSAPRPSTSNAALMKGAKAGIGVGVGIFVLLLAAAGWWWMLLRRQRQRKPSAEKDEPRSGQQDAIEPVKESDLAAELNGEGIIQEKPDDPLVELPVQPPELSSDQIHELDATPVQKRTE
ncbi:hypothetical protein O1611_g3226 [Lasiodiplodia mahajangana]|uniref:Uncharacterized protein n=1 Tax=Lasiodiplodia mahajangana TaxID=1108764 RepID=A0ACC2JSD6_9PEZI|nr:hypothetical protein O1611_g3226 [Lasiodiplodia mahajangana]